MDGTDERLKGVRGWLFLLCFNLTVLDPSAVLINLFVITDVAKPYLNQHPGFFRLLMVNGVAGIALAVFSLYAGLSLWKRLPGAPAVAKKYLAAVSAYSVAAPFLPAILRSAQSDNKETFSLNCLNSLFTLLYTGAWYLYLNKSRRVKETYGP